MMACPRSGLSTISAAPKGAAVPAIFVVLSVLAGCSTRTATYPIHQRQSQYDTQRLTEDYGVEYQYILERRQQLASYGEIVSEYRSDCQEQGCKWCDGPRRWMKIYPDGENNLTCIESPGNECDWCQSQVVSMTSRANEDVSDPDARGLTGLAFSGGGIRSASFNLGVLQALDDLHTLPRVDYMSSVSGGSYIAGWVQAHLGGNQHGMYRDDVYYKVGASDFHDLLDENGDNVEQLRTHSQFINKGRFYEGPILLWSYIWRWPFNTLLDVVLHIKGRYNTFHPIAIYQDRIENTYFRGTSPAKVSAPAKRELQLSEANQDAFRTPYLIINGNLVNHGTPRGMGDSQEQFNFEFTRYLTGSDGLGYIPTEAFDRSVKRVDVDGAGRPIAVEVGGDELETSSFRVSQAVSASGAAFDPDGFLTSVQNQWIRTPAGYAASLVNLNLGYETWNFARAYDGPFWTPVDYVRMQTYQRFVEPETDARWIKITDGGHYENLAVAALVRRGVSCIIAVDAGADPHWQFDDLKILQKRLCEHGLDLKLDAALLESARKTGHVKLEVTQRGNPHNPVSQILYLKPNADPVELADGNKVCDVTPHHMKTTYWKHDGEQCTEHLKADATIDNIRKVKWYQQSRAETSFPHTSTFIQWETFEAYRLLGYQMAKTYLPNGADLDMCEFKEQGEP